MLWPRWKTARATSRAAKNPADYVQEITKIAFRTESERLRIEVLTLLDGVGWPMASVILHFCANDRYPILDVRALWSLGIDYPVRYDCAFWDSYTTTCRDLADQSGSTMRIVDRALWQFAKVNQPRGGAGRH